MYLYRQTGCYFAQVADGLEALGADEIGELGGKNVKTVFRGMYFEADRPVLYRVNYHARIVTRVLAPLVRFGCHSPDYLYKKASAVDWGEFLPVDGTFAVFATVSHSAITHSQYAALRLKDAVVDQFRARQSSRPAVDRINPDLWINLHIERNRAVISIDTSGGSLHRRGYRTKSVEAPMQESCAAAVVRLSGWDGGRPLYDPMCGSGTILCEALMRHCRIPAGHLRERFGFERLPDFDRAAWESVRSEARDAMRPLPVGLIGGSDISKDAVAAARANTSALPNGKGIGISNADFRKLPVLRNTTIITNPPYGIRMKGKGSMEDFYLEFGDILKRTCTGCEAYVYFGEPRLIKSLGLKPSWKKFLMHGGLDGRLVKVEIY
jgi:putative N6-adenine-specific DNA methylase